MTAVFVASSFLSATLLFVVQPLVTRMVLPDFGGSAAVWTTNVLFFQAALLLGYLYTHVATSRLRPKVQVGVHLALFLVPAVVLPLVVTAQPGDGPTAVVVLRLLVGLAAGVGLPFFVISTTGPLLQRWYSWTTHRRAHDPYFLYAASNVGSMLGLLSYPVVVEPLLDVPSQASWWTGGYIALGALLVGCAVLVRRHRTVPEPVDEAGKLVPAAVGAAPAPVVEAEPGANPGPSGAARTRAGPLAWIGLAFVPSSLMLGVTTFLSTDVAAVPLLWVVPLAVYLGTFVVAFGGRSAGVARVCRRAVAPLAILGAFGSLVFWPLQVTVPLVVAAYGAIAMVFHHRLAARRPPADRLTAFYVWISVGGLLGGVANGVVAPLLLPGPFEFAIVALVAAAVVGHPLDEIAGGPRTMRFWLATAAVVVGVLAVGLLPRYLPSGDLLMAVVLALVVAAFLVPWVGPSRLAAVGAVALLVLPSVAPYLIAGEVVTRSFYSSYRVTTNADRRALFSGTTLHGVQSTDPDLADMPSSYYHPDGPVGDWLPVPDRAATIGVVGLGAGTIAAYGQPGQSVRFHEIDAAIVDLAEEHFTYLEDAESSVDVVVGDGRLTLEDVPADAYDVLVVDAFTSDSIPVHLLTEEAFALYAEVVGPEGVVLVHVSNRYLDLEPVVAAGAEANGMVARMAQDEGGNEGLRSPSAWMALTASDETFGASISERWEPPAPRRVRWTDSFSDLVSVLGR